MEWWETVVLAQVRRQTLFIWGEVLVNITCVCKQGWHSNQVGGQGGSTLIFDKSNVGGGLKRDYLRFTSLTILAEVSRSWRSSGLLSSSGIRRILAIWKRKKGHNAFPTPTVKCDLKKGGKNRSAIVTRLGYSRERSMFTFLCVPSVCFLTENERLSEAFLLPYLTILPSPESIPSFQPPTDWHY